MTTHQVYLHSGRVIWPEHKPLEEVEQLRDTTPEPVWWSTYQSTPTRPGGRTFRAAWWQGRNRYDLDERSLQAQVYARFISWDTAQKEDKRERDDHDYSACVVGELWPDYRLAIRWAYAEKLEFPDLPEQIEAVASRWNYDEKLKAVIVEDKSSGTSALQTLRAAAPGWISNLLVPFMPTTDKVTRAGQAAVWCKLNCVVMPYPRPDLYWLIDLEDQLYEFPKAAHDDLVDAISQLLLYLEHYLRHGYLARQEESER